MPTSEKKFFINVLRSPAGTVTAWKGEMTIVLPREGEDAITAPYHRVLWLPPSHRQELSWPCTVSSPSRWRDVSKTLFSISVWEAKSIRYGRLSGVNVPKRRYTKKGLFWAWNWSSAEATQARAALVKRDGVLDFAPIPAGSWWI